MILKSHSIKSADNLVKYCLQDSKIANIIHSDGIDYDDVNRIKDEFLLYNNSRLKNPYLSLILSPEIDLEDTILKTIINDTLKELKLDNHQMLAITHAEKRNTKHVHIKV